LGQKNQKFKWFLTSPDWREHPFILALAKAKGNIKDVEGKREHGLLKKPDRFAPEKDLEAEINSA
jgi:hypothetical protein